MEGWWSQEEEGGLGGESYQLHSTTSNPLPPKPQITPTPSSELVTVSQGFSIIWAGTCHCYSELLWIKEIIFRSDLWLGIAWLADGAREGAVPWESSVPWQQGLCCRVRGQLCPKAGVVAKVFLKKEEQSNYPIIFLKSQGTWLHESPKDTKVLLSWKTLGYSWPFYTPQRGKTKYTGCPGQPGCRDDTAAPLLCSLSQPTARPGHAHGGEEKSLFREEGQKRMSVVEMSQEGQLVWIDTKCSPKKVQI